MTGRTEAVSLLARLGLAAVMIVAGALKLPDPAASVRAVRGYQLLPEAVVPTVGYALPGLEVVLGFLLLVGLLTRTAAALTGALMIAFVVGIVAAWTRGLEIDCGCFGGGGGGAEAGASAKYPFAIARDLAFVAAAAWLLWRPGRIWSVDRLLAAPEGKADEAENLTTERPARDAVETPR